ncbi:hypothetical protein MtrunA17_Chr4g0075131 [Medicago truncatula]|nr:hypothetical protein MtrunA17_Chr4g0075131 [Medicago truncatula]
MCKGDDMRITGAQGFPLFALVVWLESGTGKLLQRRVEFLESCSKTYI